MEVIFLFLRYWRLLQNWDKHNAFSCLMGDMELRHINGNWSIDLVILFIGASGDSLLCWVFFLSISHYPCSGNIELIVKRWCFTHAINIIICFPKDKQTHRFENKGY